MKILLFLKAFFRCFDISSQHIEDTMKDSLKRLWNEGKTEGFEGPTALIVLAGCTACATLGISLGELVKMIFT